ncbi:MAG: lipoprotein [Acetobacteraceae bacterium]
MRVAALLLLLTMLAACGKKGPPEAPGPAQDIIYPKTYPTH